MPHNRAAWLPGPFRPLEVRDAPYTPPGEGEVVVRNRAIAVNPIDWIKQRTGDLMFDYLRYPAVLGTDISGEVEAVGPGVTRFRAGDRVVAHALGRSEPSNPAGGAFQLFTVAKAHMTAPIPDRLSHEAAATLPLGLATASAALFQRDFLALRHPHVPPRAATDEAVLIWGGSTSVGSNAIQLAAAAGYHVVTTASPKSFDDVRRLGAGAVFDYRDRDARRRVTEALRGRRFVGAVAIGDGSAAACIEVAGGCAGRRFVAIVTMPMPFDLLPDRPGPLAKWLIAKPALAAIQLRLRAMAWRRGVTQKQVMGGAVASNEVGRMLYGDFLPRALADGAYVAQPPARVVGSGLEAIQTALDEQRKGVSGVKLVVTP